MKNLNINVVFASIIACVVSFFAIQKPNEDRISVTGKCVKKVKKDRFGITASIKNIANSTSETVKKSLSTYNEISDLIKSAQSANPDMEVETTEYTTREKTVWNEKTRTNDKVGIEAIISVAISTKNPENLSDLIFSFSRFDDVFTSRLDNFVSNELYEQEKNNCLEDAVRNAKAQATTLATANNQKVGKMTSVDYRNYDSPRVGSYMLKSAKYSMNNLDAIETESAPAEMFSGSENISVSVEATFELK